MSSLLSVTSHPICHVQHNDSHLKMALESSPTTSDIKYIPHKMKNVEYISVQVINNCHEPLEKRPYERFIKTNGCTVSQ
jgi:hypothetical protein